MAMMTVVSGHGHAPVQTISGTLHAAIRHGAAVQLAAQIPEHRTGAPFTQERLYGDIVDGVCQADHD
jgi:hypothetical protein